MIYVFLADGFEEMEALAPVDILRRAGLTVQTVGIGGKTVTGSHGIPVVADCLEADVVLEQAEMVILPGGKGTPHLDASELVARSVRYCVEHDRWVGAICAAPSVLGHLGVLKGKTATCFPGFEKELTGAKLSEAYAVRDGKIITGRGAGASVEFALTIVAALCGEDKAAALRENMQCPPLA